MIISPILHIGSARKQREKRSLLETEELSEEDKLIGESVDKFGKILTYIAIGVTGIASLSGLGYVIYNHKDVPAVALRATYTP